MTPLDALTSVSLALMFVSAVFFVVIEVAWLTEAVQNQNFLMVSIGLSVAFLVLSSIVVRLSTSHVKDQTQK